MGRIVSRNILSLTCFWFFFVFCDQAGAYRNFRVAVYCRAYETREMADPNWLVSRWTLIEKQVHVDKVYLETHRDLIIVDDQTLAKAKEFFRNRGIETAGGITLTVNERNRFETFCYTNAKHRQKIREIIKHTARHFDEIILDDFFFTNCKCELCIAAKGDSSWTQYRLDLLAEASKSLIIDPAKAVNPNVKVVIKYPNWYEHFQGLGFNLEAEPPLFDGLYSGTETRDPSGNQHLQAYLGYLIFRYFDNIKPGVNGGGWVDTGGLRTLDRYAEQLWLTLFAKAPEITLFDIRQIVRPIRDTLRAPWQGQKTSFDFDEAIKPYSLPSGTLFEPNMMARAAGYTFEKVDQFLGNLGKPMGVKSYKPYHSTGEDFLHNYLGMCGIPLDLVPQFPKDANMVFLAETAKFDSMIVSNIKQHLLNGKSVMITSGLLKALQNRGIEDIAELQVTDRKAVVSQFRVGWGNIYTGKNDMVIPQIQYLTNDAWEEISALDGTNGWPILLSAGFAKGTLFVLTIPENFTDLYHMPTEILTRIKETLCQNHYVHLDGPGQTSLFLYDNGTFIVESFLDGPITIHLRLNQPTNQLKDLESGDTLVPDNSSEVGLRRRNRPRSIVFKADLAPHSYRVFQCQ